MSGILTIVMDSLKTIYENKKIYVNSTISQRRAKAELTADPVKAFYDEMCEIPSDPAVFEKKEDLYNAFVKYCKSKRLYILSYKEVIKKLKKNMIPMKVEHKSEMTTVRNRNLEFFLIYTY